MGGEGEGRWWVPLSVRESGDAAEYEVLHDGVPAWLRQFLIDWFIDRIDGESTLLAMEADLRTSFPWQGGMPHVLAAISNLTSIDPQRFLDVIDWMLHYTHPGPIDVGVLEGFLRRGGSAWTVASDDGSYCLQRRIDPAVAKVVDQAVQLDATAGHHLGVAWRLAYGRGSNPGESYRESIKAVEAAAIPVVAPTDPKATLGKLIGNIRDAPAKWSLVIPGSQDPIKVLWEAMSLLWTGQVGRHGDPNGVQQQTPASAEAAVHLAATLVHWFASGAVARTALDSAPIPRDSAGM